MKNIKTENLQFVFGGISDKDKDSIVSFAGDVGSAIGGTLGGITGGALGSIAGGKLGSIGMEEAAKDMINNPERWEHPEVSKPWDPSDKKEKKDKDNDSGSSRVICTHFYQKGMLSRELWRADMEFTLKHLPQSMVNGYHLWAIPYVKLMRKSPLAEKLMYPIAYHRAREISYQMGYTSKGSIRGKIFRVILEPICLFLGMFTKEHQYQELWRRA